MEQRARRSPESVSVGGPGGHAGHMPANDLHKGALLLSGFVQSKQSNLARILMYILLSRQPPGSWCLIFSVLVVLVAIRGPHRGYCRVGLRIRISSQPQPEPCKQWQR